MPEYYSIKKDTLDSLGDSIRSVTGSSKKFTPAEMIDEVRSILDAATFVLVDKDGNEYPAVYVDSDVVFTATANDIRKGCTAVTAEGVIEGTKEIPSYNTSEGYKLIPSGETMKITGVTNYEYTKLQALVCAFNSSISESVVTEKVCIDDKVYRVNSSELIAMVTIESENKAISLGITNDSGSPVLIRYFMYKEIY